MVICCVHYIHLRPDNLILEFIIKRLDFSLAFFKKNCEHLIFRVALKQGSQRSLFFSEFVRGTDGSAGRTGF